MQNNFSQIDNRYSSQTYNDALFNQGIGSQEFYQDIENALPPVFSRQTASKVLGSLISPKTLSNLDALKEGPSVKLRLGSKVGYERKSFMIWLKQRLG